MTHTIQNVIDRILQDIPGAPLEHGAVAQGRSKALVVLGHAKSEEPGMAYLVTWLRERFPDMPITHVPVGDAFQYV